jgi:hypothetical protein
MLSILKQDLQNRPGKVRRLDPDAFTPRGELVGNGHGLGMATKAGGNVMGVNKWANLITVEDKSPALGSIQTLMPTFNAIMTDAMTRGRFGPNKRPMSVINICELYK